MADEQPHALWTLAHLVARSGVADILTADSAAQVMAMAQHAIGQDHVIGQGHATEQGLAAGAGQVLTPGRPAAWGQPHRVVASAGAPCGLGGGRLVLLSATMPGLDVAAACAHWRAGWQGRPGQIWLMTPRASSLDLEAARQAGADRIFARPVDPDLLVRLIGDLARQWQARQGVAC